MNWMGSSDWWLNVALDGIAGAVVGALLAGLVTAVAVLLTLRQEERRRGMEALEVSLATVVDASSSTLLWTEEMSPEQVNRMLSRLVGAVALAQARANTRAPELSNLMTQVHSRLSTAMPSRAYLDALAVDMYALSIDWLADPDSPSMSRVEGFREATRDDAGVLGNIGRR